MVEVVPVVYYRVDQRHSGFSLPVIDLRDRRNAAHPPLVRWVYQKHLEIKSQSKNTVALPFPKMVELHAMQATRVLPSSLEVVAIHSRPIGARLLLAS